METYKITKLENGDILLEPFVIDNIKYTIINKENGDILLKKIQIFYITNITNIKDYDFKKSIISECSINNKVFNKLKFRPILEHIYKLINNGTKIIINTILNIKTLKKEDRGFSYLETIGISVQNVESNKCLFEIINQCIENKFSIIMKIKLINNITININI